MAATRIDETKLSIRLDKSAQGQWCSACDEVQAEYQPEMFVREGESYRFICKLCAWDHAPWLVSLINMGHYSDWEAWGGSPPTPEKLDEMGLTVTDMLGEEAQRGEIASRPTLVNQHTAMLAEYVAGGSDQPFSDLSQEDPDWGREAARSVENRRSGTRYAICIPTRVSIGGKGSSSMTATTRNMSESGAYIYTDAELEPDQQILMEFSFPTGGTLYAKSRVVRKDAQGVGVSFIQTQWRKK